MPLSTDALNQLFGNARTASAFLDKPIPEGLLRQVYDLAKMPPTSMNTQPTRYVFITSAAAKERLLACMNPGNVDKTRDYIKNTYASSDASKACQKWVDDNPDATTQKDIAAGLLETLKGLGNKAGQISKHLTGDAFDVKPVTKDADAIKKTIKGLTGIKKFLEKESGLTIWHAEF